MTRKDYERIAETIRAEVATVEALHGAGAAQAFGALERTAHELAAMFAAYNPRFDRTRFLRACGVDA